MTALLVLQAVWNFIKRYWPYIIMLGTVAGSMTYVSCQKTTFDKRLNEIAVAHQTELESVKGAYEVEIVVREANEAKLIARMTEIQKQYDTAKVELDAEKRRQVSEIVKKYGDNPDELARQLAAAAGFSIVMPTEDDTCTP